MALSVRSVVFDDSVYDNTDLIKADCEVPDWEDIDEDFNEFNNSVNFNNGFRINGYYYAANNGYTLFDCI